MSVRHILKMYHYLARGRGDDVAGARAMWQERVAMYLVRNRTWRSAGLAPGR